MPQISPKMVKKPIDAIKGITSTVIAPLQSLTIEDSSEFLKEGEALDLPVTQLEALADEFQERLVATGKVKDRDLRNRPAPRSFQGNEAVDVLVELLHQESATRAQALQVGREIQTQFQFFVNVLSTKTHQIPLRDSEQEHYQFDHNLPMQVYRARKDYPSSWDKVTLLENRVPLADHNGLLKVHHNAFMGKQAVDVLMQAKLAKSRGEAVKMIRKLNEKVYCCRMADHPQNDGSNFADDDFLYRFVPKDERIPPQQQQRKARSKSPKPKNKEKNSRRPKSPKPKRPASSTKDATYFRNRAQGVRDKLDADRRERAKSPPKEHDH